VGTVAHVFLGLLLGVAGQRTRAEPKVSSSPTELSLVSEKSWPGGGAITSVLVLKGVLSQGLRPFWTLTSGLNVRQLPTKSSMRHHKSCLQEE
jgi:hypothetical protein